ncbi:MAG: ABC transporter ATP-binding protein [Anaerolineae bacterium]|nr:ABC transporter ATP-binding protein [Anaerolineae bacterium]
MSGEAIYVENLTKRFGNFTAVDNISFSVKRGEVFGFLGPNGAGKTTTIRVLLGLLIPSSGLVRVLGHELPREAKLLHARVGYMSQLFTLYNDLTAKENILFYGQVYGLKRQELHQRMDEILEMAGLKGRENELTAGLSGGWRQRLALGCAIVHQPELLFLDEPTAGMDPVSRREFWGLIYRFAEKGTTVFVTTHYMDEAEHCQRLAFLSRGQIVALGSPDELKSSQMRGRVLEIDCDNAERAVQVLRQAIHEGKLVGEQVTLYGALVHIVVPESSSACPLIHTTLQNAGVKVRTVQEIPPSLEDVFISSVSEYRSLEKGLS